MYGVIHGALYAGHYIYGSICREGSIGDCGRGDYGWQQRLGMEAGTGIMYYEGRDRHYVLWRQGPALCIMEAGTGRTRNRTTDAGNQKQPKQERARKGWGGWGVGTISDGKQETGNGEGTMRRPKEKW